MKKHFLTGLIILIPIGLTFAVVQFLVNLLTTPFLGIVEFLFRHTVWFGSLSGNDLVGPVSKLLILIVVPAIIFGIGFFGGAYIVKYFFGYLDYFARRIPVVNTVYRSIKETVHALFEPKNETFSNVVLVPFPFAPSYCIGFITKEDVEASNTTQPMITVFVPGTPNPTAGFMLLFQKNQLIFIDMKVEDAVKYLLSLGVIATDFKSKITD